MATIRKQIEAIISPKASPNGDSGNTKGEGYNVYNVTDGELDAIKVLLTGSERFTELFYNVDDDLYYIWDVTAQNFKGVLSDILPVESYRRAQSDTYYGNWFDNFVPAGLTTGRNVLRASPMFVPRAINVDRIGMEVTTAGTAGSLIRLGIYSDDGNGRPGNLLLDAGTVTGDTIAVKLITIDQDLQPGIYWLAAVNNSAANIVSGAVPQATGSMSILGQSGTFSASPPNYLRVAFTFAALPDPFPAGYALNTGTACPLMNVRYNAYI